MSVVTGVQVIVTSPGVDVSTSVIPVGSEGSSVPTNAFVSTAGLSPEAFTAMAE